MNIAARLLQRFKNSKEAKNAGWIIGGRITQMLLSFVVSVLTARYLGPSNFGLINYGATYVTFFTALCTLGINSVIIKEFADHPDEQGLTIGSAIGMRLISSILSAIMILGFTNILDKNEPITIAVVVLCSLSLIFHVFETFNFWFQSRYESRTTAIATLIAYIITSAYKVVLLARGKDVRWFAFASSVDYICVAVLLYAAYRHNQGPKLAFSWKKCKQLLGKSYHYILSGMMVVIYGQTDRLMLKLMLNETALGYYSLAASVNSMWVFILAAIIDSIFPTIIRLHSRDKEAFQIKNRQLYAIVIYVSLFVAVCFMLFGQYIIRILYGDAFMPAVMPLKIITWYTIFSYLGVARNAWVVCENRQKYLKYMYFSAAVLNVALNSVMIPAWGPSGAAIASLITEISTSLILPCFWKEMRPNVRLMADAFLLRKIK